MEFLDDPGGQPGGRIVEAVAERLRLAALNRLVTTSVRESRGALGSALSLMLLAVLGALVLIYNHYLGMGQLMKGLG